MLEVAFTQYQKGGKIVLNTTQSGTSSDKWRNLFKQGSFTEKEYDEKVLPLVSELGFTCRIDILYK